MTYTVGDLVYNGERNGVHNWESMSGMHFYWHPDWVHIAEDETGHKAVIGFDDTTKQHKLSHHHVMDMIKSHLKSYKK